MTRRTLPPMWRAGLVLVGLVLIIAAAFWLLNQPAPYVPQQLPTL